MATGPGPDDVFAGEDFAVTHPLRPVVSAGVLSLVLFTVSALIAFLTFRTVAPPSTLLPGAIFTVLLVLVWAGLDVVMVVRRPDAEETVRLWGLIARCIIISCHVACLFLVWGVMPYGSPELQFMTVILLTAYVPSQIICSPESTFSNRLGIIVVLGSTTLFLATRGTFHATMIAVYLGAFALMMFILCGVISQTVRHAVDARLASDAAAQQLERLLANVAAERDAKTRFISSASHDLGQPLQAIALFFDQVVRARDDIARQRAIEGVRRALDSADQLLSHMLNHLRLEADAVEPHLSRVRLRAVLDRLAAQTAPAAAAAGLGIRVAGGDHVMMSDPVLLERALGNLIHNAITHSQGDRLLLAARRHGRDGLRIWVIDNGRGVGRTDARHIFDDYFQGAARPGASRVGFGLGLSSVRRVAAILGGEAGLDPRWTGGAAFYLAFPLTRPVRSGVRSRRPKEDVEVRP